MISPPHARYMLLSARVENCGPSMTTTHFSVCSWTPGAPVSNSFLTRGSIRLINWPLNGSPNIACPTMLVPSKNEEGLIPFVLSIIWEGMTKSPGRISSRKDPTAENATIALTPSDLRAAIFARVGTEDGLMLWAVPCRAMKATRTPDGRAEMVMGELGNPHG